MCPSITSKSVGPHRSRSVPANRARFYYILFTALNFLHQCPVAARLFLTCLRVEIHTSCSPPWRFPPCFTSCAWAPADLLITLPGENESWLCFTRWWPGGALCRKLGRGEQRKWWLLPGGGRCWRGGRVDTPGWPWRRRCRSHRGPLATRVNTDDFSVWPYELTLLGETQEVGLEQWQCQGR